MISLGIDIGLSGALAVIRGEQLLALEDMPTREKEGNSMVRREVDCRSLYELVLRMCGERSDEAIAVCLENVHGIGPAAGGGKGHGSIGAFSFGETRGAVRAAVEILRLKPMWIAPVLWKRRFGLVTPKGEKVDKGKARLKAVELYPSAADALARAKDHNRAEALLIARFGWDRCA